MWLQELFGSLSLLEAYRIRMTERAPVATKMDTDSSLLDSASDFSTHLFHENLQTTHPTLLVKSAIPELKPNEKL